MRRWEGLLVVCPTRGKIENAALCAVGEPHVHGQIRNEHHTLQVPPRSKLSGLESLVKVPRKMK